MTGVEELRAKLARLDAACDAWDEMVETCHRPDGDRWQAAQRRLHEVISAAAWERRCGTDIAPAPPPVGLDGLQAARMRHTPEIAWKAPAGS